MKDSKWKKRVYINYLTCVFCFIYGLKSLDNQCVTFFSEKLINELHFSTLQYSSLTALFYFSYSVSSIVFGILTSHSKLRKKWLIPMILGSGITSIINYKVNTYIGLATCRLLSGLCQGSSLALMLSILSKNLINDDYGKRNGFINAGGSMIGSVIGPIVITWLSQSYSWHYSFLLTGIFLSFLAFLTEMTVHEVVYDVPNKAVENRGSKTISELLKNKTILFCLIIGIIETTANLSISVIAPLYFSDVMMFNPIQKGFYLSLKGLTFIPISLVVPILADKKSIKYVMAWIFSLSAIAPVSAFLFKGTFLSAVLLAFGGSWAGATVTLFVYMIPRLVLPDFLQNEANGIILGCSTFGGGCLVPMVLSVLIDVGLRIEKALVICGLALLFCVVLSLFLQIPEKRETYKLA